MKLRHFFNVYRELSAGFRKVLWQTAWWSLLVELDLKLNNFKLFKRYYKNKEETTIDTLAQKKQVIWMQKTMRILEFRAPWKPMCLNRAITAKRLLRNKGIETTIHIGFKPRENEEVDFKGHAWLTINGFFITGLISELPKYNKLRPIRDDQKIS